MAVFLDTRAFLRSLAAATVAVEKTAREGVERLGENIADDARRSVPVRSGRLRDSIATTTGRKGDEVTTIAVGAPYAAFVEFGTSDTPLQPFLRPALAKARSQASRTFKRF